MAGQPACPVEAILKQPRELGTAAGEGDQAIAHIPRRQRSSRTPQTAGASPIVTHRHNRRDLKSWLIVPPPHSASQSPEYERESGSTPDAAHPNRNLLSPRQ